jgi:hypothetical protein
MEERDVTGSPAALDDASLVALILSFCPVVETSLTTCITLSTLENRPASQQAAFASWRIDSARLHHIVWKAGILLARLCKSPLRLEVRIATF